MRLWTIQPESVCRLVENGGVYRCNIEQSTFASDPQTRAAYRWMAGQMKKRIGPAPEGVQYPVWCFVKRPDLRTERWQWGPKGRYGLMEIEVPDARVLVSEFDEWHAVLNRWLISFTQDEDAALQQTADRLCGRERSAFYEKNWERIFDPTPLDNGWATRWDVAQATIWELPHTALKGRPKYFACLAKT